MELIQNAYQGFAKQNYTMLDNLKLGYGGTKTEMERLIEDANRVKKANGEMADLSIDSFADVVEAIHIIQTEMGITGTTAKEAGSTISGSVQSMKSAWTNLVTGFADGNADIEGLINNLVTTIVGDGTESNLGVIGNVLPAIERALGGVIKLIEGGATKIVEILPGLVDRITPSLISASTGMVDSVVKVVPELLQTVVNALITNAPALIKSATSLVESLIQGIRDNYQMLIDGSIQIVKQLATGILDALPQIVALGLDLIASLAKGIAESLPELIPTIVDVILKIANILTDPKNLTNILDAALVLIVNLAYGLMDAIPQLVDATVDVIEGLIVFLVAPENLAKIINAALHIVIALGSGLISAIPRLLGASGELIEKFSQQLEDTDWAKVGANIISGILDGLKKAWETITKWFTDAWDALFNVGNSSSTNKDHGGRGGSWGEEQEIVDSTYGKNNSKLPTKSFYGSTDNTATGNVTVVQNIYSESKTAADLMQEARYQMERAVWLGV